jgi:hypothetical protein
MLILRPGIVELGFKRNFFGFQKFADDVCSLIFFFAERRYAYEFLQQLYKLNLRFVLNFGHLSFW